MTRSAPPNFVIHHRALWEKAGKVLACRVLVCAATLGSDEYAGMIAGYVGGQSIIEPFHVRFKRERATHLVVGDLNALAQVPCFSESWPLCVRQAVAHCRQRVRSHAHETSDGLWVASLEEVRRVKPLKQDLACGQSGDGGLDERVWATISAHFGAPAGLES